jgi:hypothetical protein
MTKKKTAERSGSIVDFDKLVAELINSSNNARDDKLLALLSIEKASNAMDEVLDDKKLSDKKKLLLIRKYTDHIIKCVIDGTSFKYTIKD